MWKWWLAGSGCGVGFAVHAYRLSEAAFGRKHGVDKTKPLESSLAEWQEENMPKEG